MSTRPVAWVKLEEEAYYAVLRALAVTELNWEKEKLLTDLRTILHITNDQHFKFLEEVMGDKLVTRLRNLTANTEANKNQVNNANSMPPPPPRQQTPATGNNSRKHGRPNSAGPKFPPSSSPAPQRPHRLSEAGLGERRSKSLKKSEASDLKRHASTTKSGRGLPSQRSRGRGRRITALPREHASPIAIVQPRAKRKMFASTYVKKIAETGSEAEISALYSELEAQSRAIDHHMSLINQLDDESLAEKDAAKFCQLAIEELEMAYEMIEAEETLLQSSDEDVTEG